MSVPRTLDNSFDLTVQPTVNTLHIPASHTFIPFQQFSLSDGSGLRNPADDNNNKTAIPAVSVVAAVSGLCPALPVVSMQQTAQLVQSVVTPTILPTVVTPMTVHTGNLLTPTTTMTVSKTLNIGSHISVPLHQQQQQQQTVGIQAIAMTSQAGGTINGNMNPNIITATHHNTASSSGNKPPNVSSNTGTSSSSPSNNSSNATPKPSVTSKTSTSSQSVGSEQNEDLVKPVFKDGELVLEVECGQNKAILYLSKLCQGSKGPCISFQSSWLTPNEFQFVSGRETAKDWKRSIRHHGKSLKLLLAKGILNVHPTMCDCDGCRQGATLTRKGEKRRIPNGERKPRRPTGNSGNVGSDGNTTGSFRPPGSSTMAAHSTSPGAGPAKPEVRRSAVDKPKMADTAAQSPLIDVNSKLFARPPTLQRPSAMNTPRDGGIKPKLPSSTSASTCSLIPTSSSSLSPTASVQLNSPSVSFTSGLAQPFPIVATLAVTLTTTTNPAPFIVTSLSPLSLSAPSAVAPSVAAAFLGTHVGYPTSNPVISQEQSSNFQSNPPAHTQTSPGENGHLQSSAETTDTTAKHELEMSDDDDNQFGDDTDESQNMDDEDLDDDSDDEQSEKSSNDSMSDDDQVIDEAATTHADDEEAVMTSSSEQQNKNTDNIKTCNDNTSSFSDNTKEFIHAEKEHSNPVETAESEKPQESSLSKVTDPEDKLDIDPQSVVSPHTPVTTLAVSTFSGTCSQPLTLAISSTNIKSEHIWVPPRLSPQGDPHNIHHAQTGANKVKSPTEIAQINIDNFKIEPPVSFGQSQDIDKTGVPRKMECQPPQSKDVEHPGPKLENIHGITSSKEFQSIERHLAGNSESERVKGELGQVKGDSGQVKPVMAGNSVTNEKNIREREREERHRQRVREERNRREREERNRKDREREERREFERREEKDSEKRRHEEKERREAAKAQSENNPNMDSTSHGGIMDPSRRPPGGVAEAAAFSDYMRMLAAGHGHQFLSPALSYMPAILPFRPQEASLPTHLLHPMSAFGHQLNGLHKEPMLYQTTSGVLPNYGTSPFGPLHPLLQRQQQYSTQQTLLDYQRSLSAASSYSWPAAYPYFLHDISASSPSASSAAAATANLAAGGKRSSAEIESAMELSSKRMRLDGRTTDYTSPWDYFAAAAAAAAASQHQRVPIMTPSLPCGLESASMDKTAEYLRKRYLEYGPQAAAYLAAVPDYARSAYHCACADHRDDNIHMWSVEDVCKFLHTVDGCAVYTDHFREQRVTGRILALLSSDHLVKTMGMKLGPAVLLAEAVTRKLQDSNKMSNCEACRNIALSQPLHPMALPL